MQADDDQRHDGGADRDHDPTKGDTHAASIRASRTVSVKTRGADADGSVMAGCTHGLDPTWCYLCRVEDFGVDPQVLWGVALDGDLSDLERSGAPMSGQMAGYLRFLAGEFELGFDPTFTQGEAATVIASFLIEPATASQLQTLGALSGGDGDQVEPDLTYAGARLRIRRTVALRGLRSA